MLAVPPSAKSVVRGAAIDGNESVVISPSPHSVNTISGRAIPILSCNLSYAVGILATDASVFGCNNVSGNVMPRITGYGLLSAAIGQAVKLVITGTAFGRSLISHPMEFIR